MLVALRFSGSVSCCASVFLQSVSKLISVLSSSPCRGECGLDSL